ncbi:hypothetical protein SAMN05421848_1793 [Kushneria avicenniae]|uniref:Uncharacterized protein n=1 Tax=Kushneria avicenniae TaxID=402385 RepID=A0A1I1JX10_9GAMM|nr:hypothetical protein SAMN05421848_1793 [Kushneria avicenniae]
MPVPLCLFVIQAASCRNTSTAGAAFASCHQPTMKASRPAPVIDVFIIMICHGAGYP